MENASNALLMAAGVLIGVLILSLAVFLFMDFGAKSKEIHSQIEETQLTQYNAQYTIYENRNDITIYDVVTLANLAKENNEFYKDYTNYENNYKVQVIFQTSSTTYQNFQDESIETKQNLINTFNAVKQREDNVDIEKKFKCQTIEYNEIGKVKKVTIQSN